MLVSHSAPDFTAPAVLGNGEIVNDFNLFKFINKKEAIIFFWPMDFTFVCPSELIACNNRYLKFKEKKVEIVGISIDSVFVHSAWRQTSFNKGGVGPLQYPMVSDIKRDIIKTWGIEHINKGIALRASFLIDKVGIVRHQIVNDLPFGRDFDEIMRMVDAIQFHETHGLLCPAQWKKNKTGLKNTQEGISNYLSHNLSQL